MSHEVGAEEKITYGRNDRFEGGPVGGGRFWIDDDGRPAAQLGGPREWRFDSPREFRAGDSFTVGGQTWEVVEIVDAESTSAYLRARRTA
ncbi:hypothetical protein CLV63_1272 [Murinocardiopsis flavida]|uniref:Uncharacterized protein n=1 Tax=Murinocardiopsis flavida TaxID=645275 RepID=A0A2P8CW21_9ACTN|nr:DUF6406 domain-containing protein [Murinocardiopsis flavida]PSK89129.1 hypothetical protein CLV63_1272 [Murinocardiopsis flavida]